MTSLARFSIYALLLVLIAFGVADAGCADHAAAPPPNGDYAQLAANTKVLDDDTRAALASFDATTGAMAFARATPLLDAVQVGDILASRSNPPNAPYGFLRRVGRIDRSGAGLAFQTTPAALSEALTAARVARTGPMNLDPSTFHPAMPGISLVAPRAASPSGLRTQGIPSDHGYHLHLDHWQFKADSSQDGRPNFGGDAGAHESDGGGGSGDPEGSVSGTLTLDGDIALDSNFNINIDMDWTGVHHFIAEAELDADTSLTIDAALQGQLQSEVNLVQQPLAVIDIQVGPFPIVFVPKLTIALGVQGNIQVQVSFSETSSTQTTIGARYDDGRWTDLNGSQSTGQISNAPTLQASATVSAYVKVEGSILLYGIAGPAFSGQLGLEIDCQTPRHPFARAGVDTTIAASLKLDLWVVSFEYDVAKYEQFVPFWESPNAPPLIVVTSPGPGASIGAAEATHTPIDLSAVVWDLEDGPNVDVRWSDVLDGPLGGGSHVTPTLRSPTPGPRAITVTATDRDGATSTTSATLNVVASPSIHPYIDQPSSGYHVYAGQPFRLLAHVDDPNVFGTNVCIVDHYSLTWSSSDPNDTFSNAAGCPETTATLSGDQANHTITLTAADPYGITQSAQLDVLVTTPPPGTIAFTEPNDGATYQATNGALPIASPIVMAVAAVPNAATYTWSATSYNSDGTTFASTQLAVTTAPTYSWAQPNATSGFISISAAQSGHGQNINLHVVVSDASGHVLATGDLGTCAPGGPATCGLFFEWVPG